MKQEIELELKNIVTYDEFERLLQYFSLSSQDFVKQVNYYFDTSTFHLKSIKSALRIREKQDQFMLTLKQPHHDALLESHEKLTKEEAEAMITNQKMITGKIASLLSKLDVPINDLQYLGSLTTYRIEKTDTLGTLVFDHSVYLGKEDYELEYEISDLQEGTIAFNELLSKLQIPRRKTANKIERFFYEKQSKIGD